MAIYAYCTECRTNNDLVAKACSKCGQTFDRSKKFRVVVKSKGVRVSRVVDNLTIARETEAALKGDIVRGEFDIKDHRVQEKLKTLNDVWTKYLPWAQQHKKSWKDDALNYGKHLEPRFGSRPLEEITPLDIERMKTELKQGKNQLGKPYQPATIKHQLVLLNRLFNVAGQWGLFIGSNPMRHVKKPRLDNQITEFLSSEEMRRLLDILDTWPCRESAAFVRFAMLTGMRRGEIIKLKWENIDLQRNTLRIMDPKGGTSTTIPLSAEAVQVLLDMNRASDYCFPGPAGKMRKGFNGQWQRIRKAADLPDAFRFHGLRHNLASHLVSNGLDLLTVGKLLCHKTPTVTARYAHLADSTLKRAAELGGKLLSARPEKIADVIPLTGRKEN